MSNGVIGMNLKKLNKLADAANKASKKAREEPSDKNKEKREEALRDLAVSTMWWLGIQNYDE